MDILNETLIRYLVGATIRTALFFVVGSRLRSGKAPRWKISLAAVVLVLFMTGRHLMPTDYLYTIVNQILRIAVFTFMFAWLYKIQKRYAFFLGVVLTELIGIWRGVVTVTLPWACFELFGEPLSLSPNAETALDLCLSSLCVLVMSRKWIQIDPERTIDNRELFISLFPTGVCFLNILSIHFKDFGSLPAEGDFVGIMAALVALNATALLIVLIASEQYFLNQKQKSMLKQADQQINHQYDLFMRRKADEDRLRIIYHDLQNHLSVLRELSEEKGRKYLGELMDQTEDELSKIDTGNATLNVLIEQKRQACKSKDIALLPYVSFRDGGFLTQMEVCALFGNAIDNAIEAIERDEADNRTIKITGGTIANCLVVQIENQTKSELQFAKGLPQTAKGDAFRHGLGLRSIQQILKSHEGALSIEVKDSRFILQWIMPIPRKG